ncbi:MAG: hypothetical protein SF053_14385 [Bacteroidia bacterium]|nr:hypothetical protein [Bacteroidia bacterium]
MKQAGSALTFLCLVITFFLWGCPVGVSYPLGEMADAQNMPQLIGTWVTDDPEAEMKKLSVTAGDKPGTYRVEVLEKGSSYAVETTSFLAWTTLLEGKTFLIAQEIATGLYFHYYLESSGTANISLSDVTLKVGGIDAITSVAAFREEVRASLAFPDVFVSRIDWHKP